MKDKQKAIEVAIQRWKNVDITTLEINTDDEYVHVIYEHKGITREIRFNNFFSHYNLVNIISDIISYQIDTDRQYNINTKILSNNVEGKDDISLIRLLVNNSLEKENIISSISKVEDESKFEVNLIVKDTPSEFHDYGVFLLDYTNKTIGEVISEIVAIAKQK